MSNDLINRSALMQSLRNNVLVDVTQNLEQAIAEQPAAYDMDKVVERLEENAEYFQSEADELAQVGDWGTAAELEGRAKAYRDAAEIVKSGGIE